MGSSTANLSLLPFVSSIAFLALIRPAYAFGAGNIGATSKIEGQNWRHGDLEDVFLTLVAAKCMGGAGKKFGRLDVKRIYFGNWLRDYSQAIDVGTLKHVSAEAIRILLWVLGFMSFGYGTAEFEVTTSRLGCYRPEEHIDNPKDYADNEDARRYDRRLRGPVDERRELSVDPETGMKAYIASESLGIATSAGLVRELLGRSIRLGRKYARSGEKADLHEALRLMGTGCHCLEDFSAHSNYVELALLELGERDVFAHVGRDTQIRLRGARHAVYPIVTGTFGGVDFLHSVTGEFDDKATQSEIQELEGTLQEAQSAGQNPSVLQSLLSKLPAGILGGNDSAGQMDELQQNAMQHQMQHAQVSPRQPEEWLRYLTDTQKQIYPILEWHDKLMQGISEAIEKIPILPDLIEQVQDQINMFVFSLLAPFVLPIIQQVKSELNTGSSAIIQSSEDKQHIVFHDDRSSDPTHSMLSKDHFSNVLNEPAGKVAGACLRWVVPQLMAAWDNERVDIDRTVNRIIRGILHHPALREMGDDGASEGRREMFSVVEQWWREKSEDERSELRRQLSRQGVQSGRNHKPGVHDHGHGSAKKLGMPNTLGGASSGGSHAAGQIGEIANQAVGGGALGSLVSGLAGAVGGGVLGSLIGESGETQTYQQSGYSSGGGRMYTTTEVSGGEGRYEQSQYASVEEPCGGRRDEFSRYQQESQASGQWRAEERHEERTSYDGRVQTETRYEQTSSRGYGQRQEEYGEGERRASEHGPRSRRNDNGHDGNAYGRSSDGNHHEQQEEQRFGGGEYESNRFEQREDTYSRTQRDDRDNDSRYGRHEESYQRLQGRYGGGGYEAQHHENYGGDDYQSNRRQGYGGDYRSDQNDRYGSATGGYQADGRQEYSGDYQSERREGHRGGEYYGAGNGGGYQQEDLDSGGRDLYEDRDVNNYGQRNLRDEDQDQEYNGGNGYSDGYGEQREEQERRGQW